MRIGTLLEELNIKALKSLLLCLLILVVLVPVVLTLNGKSHLDAECLTSTTCQESPWTEPFPTCNTNTSQCSCYESRCVHYTLDKNETIQYFCGKCGGLRSLCHNDSECDFPLNCAQSGYCLCSDGYLEQDVCIYWQPVPLSKESIALIGCLVGLLVLNKLISSWKFLKKIFLKIISCNRCRRCASQDSLEAETEYGYNPESAGKTAAYTISSREFLVTSNDPDLELAIQLSIQESETLRSGLQAAEGDGFPHLQGTGPEESGIQNDIVETMLYIRNSESSSSISSLVNHPYRTLHSYRSTSSSNSSSSQSSPVGTFTGTIQRSRLSNSGRRTPRRDFRYSSHSSMEVILRPRFPSISSVDSTSPETTHRARPLPSLSQRRRHRGQEQQSVTTYTTGTARNRGLQDTSNHLQSRHGRERESACSSAGINVSKTSSGLSLIGLPHRPSDEIRGQHKIFKRLLCKKASKEQMPISSC